LNLGKLAYYISKGDIDATKTITMKDLQDCGCLNSIKFGVKVLSKGAEKLKELGIPIHLEASDASVSAIEMIRSTGGSIRVVYRTPLLMRYHLKPHKFASHKELKTPMPPQKRVIKLERLKEKGLDVDYPRAPWYTDNKEAILAEEAERIKRMQQGQYVDLLPQLPADRSAGCGKDRPRVERKELPRVYKFPL
jgi:large subunit ribosomal protein L15